jgi:hypothetical protein
MTRRWSFWSMGLPACENDRSTVGIAEGRFWDNALSSSLMRSSAILIQITTGTPKAA